MSNENKKTPKKKKFSSTSFEDFKNEIVKKHPKLEEKYNKLVAERDEKK